MQYANTIFQTISPELQLPELFLKRDPSGRAQEAKSAYVSVELARLYMTTADALALAMVEKPPLTMPCLADPIKAASVI
jgi:hypothetical protein